MLKKVYKKTAFILAIILLGGLGGVLADRYLFPYLASTSFFSKYSFFQNSAEDTTVINRIEQVYVKEETATDKITSQTAAVVVNIVSTSNNPSKNPIASMNGAGTIVTSDGLIMTYVSAIIPANAKYKAILNNGQIYDAELQGVDSYSNLAFLKIDASNLPVIALGNSEDNHAGDKIIAIGNNAGDYNLRYAGGFLSSFNPAYNLAGKTVSSSEKLEGVFETDLVTAENYAGGPAVDYTGHVAGIIGSLQKDNKFEFFVLPANKVKNVINRAIEKNLGADPVLGVYFLPITKTVALNHGLSVEKGALIFSPSGQQGLAIIAGSPAQKAGLMINNIILSINGQEINAQNSLPDMLYQFRKGDTVELNILRAGQETKIPVQL